jgi:uncharacterized membrane protein YdbT with pleckstrin-like domain
MTMSYVESVLHPDERVVAMGRMHWIIYARSALVFLFGIAIVAFGFGFGNAAGYWVSVAGVVVMLFALLMAAGSWIEQWTTEIAVTNRRVIQKTGLIRRSTSEMNMDKVESVLVNQSLFGRLFDYGSVVVRGTGAGMEGLKFIGRPLELRSAIVVPDARTAAVPATPPPAPST